MELTMSKNKLKIFLIFLSIALGLASVLYVCYDVNKQFQEGLEQFKKDMNCDKNFCQLLKEHNHEE
jgi:hypothetical protein